MAIYQARHPLIAADKIVPNDNILVRTDQALLLILGLQHGWEDYFAYTS